MEQSTKSLENFGINEIYDDLSTFCQPISWLKCNRFGESGDIALCYLVEGIVDENGDTADAHVVRFIIGEELKLVMETKIFHPNIAQNGEVFLPSLDENPPSPESLPIILIQLANYLTFNEYDLENTVNQDKEYWEEWMRRMDTSIPTQPQIQQREQTKIKITIPSRSEQPSRVTRQSTVMRTSAGISSGRGSQVQQYDLRGRVRIVDRHEEMQEEIDVDQEAEEQDVQQEVVVLSRPARGEEESEVENGESEDPTQLLRQGSSSDGTGSSEGIQDLESEEGNGDEQTARRDTR